MDVIFDVNLSTTEGKRWCIDIQLKDQLSPVLLTLMLTLRPHSENHLAAFLTPSNMHTQTHTSWGIFKPSSHSSTFCHLPFYAVSRPRDMPQKGLAIWFNFLVFGCHLWNYTLLSYTWALAKEGIDDPCVYYCSLFDSNFPKYSRGQRLDPVSYQEFIKTQSWVTHKGLRPDTILVPPILSHEFVDFIDDKQHFYDNRDIQLIVCNKSLVGA